MRAQVPLGRVAGIPVGLNWSVLAAFGLFTYLLADGILPSAVPGRSPAAYWATGLGVATLLFLALLAHELAHALTARHHGVEVKGITLWMLGGVTQLGDEAPTARQHLQVAVAGPLVSLVAGTVFAAAAWLADRLDAPGLIVAGLVWLAATNGVLALFNLLPGAPLDGGRVLQALLWMRRGERDRAAVDAARVGRGLGLVLGALGLVEMLATTAQLNGLWLVAIGWFVMSASRAEEAAAERRARLGAIRVIDVMGPPSVALPAEARVTDVRAQLLAQRQDVFPVIDGLGRLLGLVRADDLRRASPDHDTTGTLGALADPRTASITTTPDELLADLLPRAQDVAAVPVLVDGRVVALVTQHDLGIALVPDEVHRLAHPPA